MALKDKYTDEELEKALSRYDANRNGGFTGSYEQQLRELADKIQNRDKFSYDYTSDPTYQAYKQQYTQMGQKAMKDTIGQGSMLTGGYNNSYAQSAGQQSYNNYLDKLNGIVPDLQAAALDRYNAEGNELYRQYSMLGELAADEYGKYRDALSDQRYEDETAYNRGRDAISDQRYADETAWERQRYEDERNYERQQQQYSRLVYMITGAGYVPNAQELSAAGMSQGEANALYGQWVSDNIKPDSTGGYSGGGGGYSGGTGGLSSYGYDTHGMSDAQIRAMQQAAGIAVDGIWGPNTEAAYQAMYGGGNAVYNDFIDQLEATSNRSQRRTLIQIAQSNGIIDAAAARELERLYNH